MACNLGSIDLYLMGGDNQIIICQMLKQNGNKNRFSIKLYIQLKEKSSQLKKLNDLEQIQSYDIGMCHSDEYGMLPVDPAKIFLNLNGQLGQWPRTNICLSCPWLSNYYYCRSSNYNHDGQVLLVVIRSPGHSLI